jgi:hypothetical protein
MRIEWRTAVFAAIRPVPALPARFSRSRSEAILEGPGGPVSCPQSVGRHDDQ